MIEPTHQSKWKAPISIASYALGLPAARKNSVTAKVAVLQARPTLVQKQRKENPLYRPELDALRFFIFLMVFAVHGLAVRVGAGSLRHHLVLEYTLRFIIEIGRAALPIFFFLSAFVITALLMQERQSTGQVHLRPFYLRRVLRVWPLYLTFLFATFLLGHFWQPAQFSLNCLIAFLLLSGNWYMIFSGVTPHVINILWSISVDEQFYLLWPVLLRKPSVRSIRILCSIMIASSLLACYIVAARHGELWYNSATQTIFFATGGIFGLKVGLAKQIKSAGKALAGMGIALLLVSAARACSGHGPYIPPFRASMTFLLMDVGAIALVWSFLHIPSSWIRPWMVYLGRISYGLYVFHNLLLTLGEHYIRPYIPFHLDVLVTLALTTLTAMFSYKFLEKPFLRIKYQFEIVHSRKS